METGDVVNIVNEDVNDKVLNETNIPGNDGDRVSSEEPVDNAVNGTDVFKDPVASEDEDKNVDPREIVPDIKELTIKNLDTGEEFVIGENDPDFEFDTFEIRGSLDGDGKDGGDNETVNTMETGETTATTRHRIWVFPLLNYLYGAASSKKKSDAQNKIESELQKVSTTSKPKTPFTKLSSFKFRKELGRGAFGRVLLAEAKTDGKLYALKIVSKKNMRSSDKRQAKAERDILHAMTLKSPHPFTSGLKFAFQSENNLYLGLDYIPGGNLRELIKRFKCLPESWVQVYAAQLVLAISHLHSLNVLYRDIKPHNVMIDARGHLVLIDFGLSKQEISHPRGALSLVGTPDYSAPEVLKTGVQQIEANNREKASSRKKKIPKSSQNSKLPMIGYGKAADWWSLGIMIYEMLSGIPTFRGADLRQTYQKILYADLEFVPEEKFSPAARCLLQGLIKRDPSLRLGAWENPPQDIMGSPFFIGIQWDKIYERVNDGPWIPEVQVFGSSKTRNSSVAVGGAGDTPKDGTPRNGEGDEYAGFDAVNPRAKSKDVTATTGRVSEKGTKRGASVDRTNTAAGNHEKASPVDDDDSSDSESSDGAEAEDDDVGFLSNKDMRDSVFILSKGQLDNKLADWSFIDEQVLRSTIEAGEYNSEEATLERRRRRQERREARALARAKHSAGIDTVHEDEDGSGGSDGETGNEGGDEETSNDLTPVSEKTAVPIIPSAEDYREAVVTATVEDSNVVVSEAEAAATTPDAVKVVEVVENSEST